MCSILGNNSRTESLRNFGQEEEESSSSKTPAASTASNLKLIRKSSSKERGSNNNLREAEEIEEEEEEEDEEEEEEEMEEDVPLNLASASSSLNYPENNEYFLPFKKLAMSSGTPQERSATKKRGLPGFSIDDILSHKTAAMIKQQKQSDQPIVRPWDDGSPSESHPEDAQTSSGGRAKFDEDEGESLHARRTSGGNEDSSPLDALFQMASKTFEGLKAKSELDHAQLSFSNKQPPKKKRKSRTAFTNHQIFELEKRFLYQKYLSPADRDEIASHLGLSNAQVITWFQNRRAKLKRDMEELRKDVECTSQVIPHHPGLAVAAVAMASRNLSSSPTKFGLNHHHHALTSPPLMALHQSPGTSPSPPRSEGDRSSPQIRVTDSDG